VIDFYVNTELLLSAEVLESLENGNKIIEFDCEIKNFYGILDKIGVMPLPPYITEKLEDNDRYNTIFSKEIENKGSSAAPTAGLHFTEKVFAELEKKGVDTAYLTLQVGLGTFRPVQAENILEHEMHTENFTICASTIAKISEAIKNGNRIICVGTTSCRTLESLPENILKPPFSDYSASTNIFIYPSKNFKYTNGLITNFHIPESTLIMLVCAFAGYENIMNAYKIAINQKYRFFSFGDCMLIL
jgi:S-adenosylmethionine:tRNA ribosyltransferase-isomerase